jgi:hypothetical protein
VSDALRKTAFWAVQPKRQDILAEAVFKVLRLQNGGADEGWPWARLRRVTGPTPFCRMTVLVTL